MALSLSSRSKGYDVFLSFRGEDTRDHFTSHLYSALSKKKILTFMDNKEIKRGEEVSYSISRAIEESTISVVIFSEKYAFSKWCLAEVAKVMECRKEKGLIVIPVFYGVDPMHVRNQAGSFGVAFAQHEHLFNREMDKVETWRAALKQAATIAGWDSSVHRPESHLIEEIVKDISNKLHDIIPNDDSKGLVGIDSRLQQIESLLCLESLNVHIVGIWGMGGIGKTTLARAIFNHISPQFESCFFLVNVREQLKRSVLQHLRDEVFSKLLDEDNINNGRSMATLTFLRRKKILLVLDDIDNSIHLQELLPGQHDLFGPGSRIIITSRDKQVLKNGADTVYQVEELNQQEALQLFCLNAFKKCSPPDVWIPLSKRAVKYAKGNPLALKVLGCALFDKSKQDWESALQKLENVPNCEIQNVLRVSFDGLDSEEKNIFLDIACFFRGEDRIYATDILDGCYSSVHFTISTFIDKSLVSISWNKLEMHDLIQEMGWSIVVEESSVPERRSRLWNSKDICCVLKKKKGNKAIKGISLDLSEAKELQLDSDAFDGMDHLRILKFFMSNSSIDCKGDVKLPRCGLVYLSDELRYLHWYRFPSKSLPPKFCAENLVVLDLPRSNVKQLWTGVQDLTNLKYLDLPYSKHLTKIPDLSHAKNVQSINLEGCKSLVELPSSIQNLQKLEFLNLRYCKNLKRLPSRIDSQCLRNFDISNCSNVKHCPEFPGNVEELHLCRSGIKELAPSVHKQKTLEIVWLIGCFNVTRFAVEVPLNIRELYLSETAIKEVPSCIQSLTSLEILEMVSCTKLVNLPSCISKLKSLEILTLSGCTKLESFPEFMEPMERLACLYLDLCENVKKVTDSIKNLKSLEHLHLSGTAIQELPSSIEHLTCLKELKLDGCKKLVRLPDSIHKLSQLRSLYLNNCSALQRLVELPSSLRVLEAHECRISEDLSSSNIYSIMNLSSTNCYKLDQNASSESIRDDASTIQLMKSKLCGYEDQVRILYPGSEIPEIFKDRNSGTSVTIELSSNWHECEGIGFCVVFVSKDPSMDWRISRVKCECRLKSRNPEYADIICNWVCLVDDLHLDEQNQALLWYEPGWIAALQGRNDVAQEENWFNHYSVATFQLYPLRWRTLQKHCKVLKCGVALL
ncbi:Disease resistance protein (TIR-NBS-LRR class) family [Euphorbia peplus]|nr:Disease resistance protein (TIR-NBS-LRR class) family [Euphorbia peplus]